jgi:sodium-dependent phosphate cotransporter
MTRASRSESGPVFRRGLGRVGRLVLWLVCLDAFLVALPLLGAFRDVGEGVGGRLLLELAGNPALGLFVGILVTSILQSSSSTTSLVVGLAAAGAMGGDPRQVLAFAVPVIMGANIGTAVTTLIVSFAHMGRPSEFRRAFSCALVHDLFNIYTVALLFPLQLLTNFLGKASWAVAGAFSAVGGLQFVSPLKLVVAPQAEALGTLLSHQWAAHLVVNFLLAAVFLAGLIRLVKLAVAGRIAWPTALGIAAGYSLVMWGIQSSPGLVYSGPMARFGLGVAVLLTSLVGLIKLMRTLVVGKLERLMHEYIFKTTVRALLFGMVVTAIVQSSSVTTSIAVPLAGAGILALEQIYPYALGANVGTTVTAMLAALSLGEPLGIAVALAHLGFNILGISIMLPLRFIPIRSAKWLADQAGKTKLVPIAFLLVIYFLLPLALIFGLR